MANYLPALFLVALCIPIAGSGRPQAPKSRPSPEATEAMRLYRQGDYAAAAQKFEAAYRLATSARDYPRAISILNNLASCRMIGFQYRDAMKWLGESRALAQRLGDDESEGVIRFNLGQLYALMGDYSRAIQSVAPILDRPLHAFRANSPVLARRPMAQIIVANAHHRLGHHREAEQAYQEAVAAARAASVPGDLALALDHYGLALLETGQLQRAVAPIEESAAIRRTSVPHATGLSERSLARLRLAEGRPAEALPLLQSALARQMKGYQITPIFNLYADRAQAYRDLGQDQAALADLREAMRLVRRWRIDLLPAAGLQVAWEADLHRLRSAYVEHVATLARKLQREALTVEALQVAEESRALALRGDLRLKNLRLPPEYAEKALQLQQAESLLLAGGPRAAELRLHTRQLEQELIELEVAAGLSEGAASVDPVPPAIPRPRPGEVRFSYFLGSSSSWRWEITTASISVKRLPPESVLASLVARFRDEISHGNSTIAGAELYSQIFGEISPVAQTTALWSIVPDGALFAAPLAALPVRNGDRYLLEDRVVRVIASAMIPPAEPSPVVGELLAVGDPVYNRADRRWRGPVVDGLELPRLAASGAEVENVARAWTGPAAVLSGTHATRVEVLAVMDREPGALHVATHFVESDDRRQTYIALGRGPGANTTDLLGPETIRTLRTVPRLIVLNGCESGRGPVLAGTGLMGLTRAWLAAGAQEVAASHWPVPDDNGEMFARMYRSLRGPLAGSPAAVALRQAQLEMLRAPDWRREPRYWSAFFVVSKG